MISLNELLADNQAFHSVIQMDSFITARAGGTLYGCYRQAIRELSTRIEALRGRYLEIGLLKIKIEKRRSRDSGDGFRAQKARLFLADAEMRLADIHRLVCEQEGELVRFYGQAIAIRSELEKQGVPFPIDFETRYRLDCEMWEHQMRARAAIDLLSSGRLQNTTIELIQSLPAESRSRVGEWIGEDAQDSLVKWFLNYEVPLPEPTRLTGADAKSLIECSELSALPRLSPSMSPTDVQMSQPISSQSD